ncbi:MAG: M28 family peptidase [Bacteroidota bacterium]|nr:M28 family peptidase [Bacteroidota bacterium]
MHIQYLASDKLMGRMTGQPGNDEAARYIAECFREYNLEFAPGMTSYFQPVRLIKEIIPTTGTLVLMRDTLRLKRRFIPVVLTHGTFQGDAVFARFGIVDSLSGRDDYAGVEVEGKIVIVRFGKDDSTSLQDGLKMSRQKYELARARKAAAFIEILSVDNTFAWNRIVSAFAEPSIQLAREMESEIHWLYVYDPRKQISTALAKASDQKRSIRVSLNLELWRQDTIVSNNVLGVIRGKDPVLRNEYVVLSAHYDHVGVKSKAYAIQDSIYNGARDNAMGTTALLLTAKYLAAQPPKRSILVLAFTAEELGLLGSRYYVQHPVVPNSSVVYNLNADNVGYNDTTIITVFGYGRTSVQNLINEAAKTQGLVARADNMPDEHLFDRSDNASFASVGIPAVTIAAGITAFDNEVLKYYHQPADQADEYFNFAYLTRYVNTVVTACRMIADAKNRPRWIEGDVYEEAFYRLYGKNSSTATKKKSPSKLKRRK